jgi:hypothetical protein
VRPGGRYPLLRRAAARQPQGPADCFFRMRRRQCNPSRCTHCPCRRRCMEPMEHGTAATPKARSLLPWRFSSKITRYGLIDAASLISQSAHSANQECRALGEPTRRVPPRLAGDRSIPAIALHGVSSVSLASPTTHAARQCVLLTSWESSLAWLVILPSGTPNPVRATLQPTPRIMSASFRNRLTRRGLARPPCRATRDGSPGTRSCPRSTWSLGCPGLGQRPQFGPGSRPVHPCPT